MSSKLVAIVGFLACFNPLTWMILIQIFYQFDVVQEKIKDEINAAFCDNQCKVVFEKLRPNKWYGFSLYRVLLNEAANANTSEVESKKYLEISRLDLSYTASFEEAKIVLSFRVKISLNENSYITAQKKISWQPNHELKLEFNQVEGGVLLKMAHLARIQKIFQMVSGDFNGSVVIDENNKGFFNFSSKNLAILFWKNQPIKLDPIYWKMNWNDGMASWSKPTLFFSSKMGSFQVKGDIFYSKNSDMPLNSDSYPWFHWELSALKGELGLKVKRHFGCQSQGSSILIMGSSDESSCKGP